MTEPLYFLKTTLQNHGAVRPEAWEMISTLLHVDELAVGESMQRTHFGISFLAEGLLKEYAIFGRKQPRIVNYLQHGQFFYHSRHHAKRYVKAIVPCIIYSLSASELELLAANFKELRPIYDQFCELYDDQLASRSALLEMSNSLRINHFKMQYAPILPYLKKKDIAQYLSISYNYLVETWNA